MARISLSPKFLKEVLMLFRERSLKEIFFGKQVQLSHEEENILRWVKEHSDEFKTIGGRSGLFQRVDPIHKASGRVWLLPNKLGNVKTQSLIIFNTDTKITSGPDLWVYLSSNPNVKANGLGDYLELVLIKGTKGGQAFVVDKSIAELMKYKSVVIWCKQFAVLFSYAALS